MRPRRFLDRRRTAKVARFAEMTPLVLRVREVAVVALGASNDAAVMGHLLAAIDSLDAALAILAPDEPPADIFAFSKGAPDAH